MINIANDIKFLVDADELSKSITHAIEKTSVTLIRMYANKREISIHEITATRDNKFKSLAFLKYFPRYEDFMDQAWVNNVFDNIHNTSTEQFIYRCNKNQGFLCTKESIPKTLAREFRRGLRVFLLALWSEKAILLPMSFSLPASARGKEFCSDIYTEVLATYRKPFISHEVNAPDISRAILKRSRRNFDWYAWRPIIASDWHKIEDINETDLIALFNELNQRKSPQNQTPTRPAYPLSPPALLIPLTETIPDRCKFTLAKVTIHNPTRCQTPDILKEEIDTIELNTSDKETKLLWVSFQERYLTQLRTVKRIKNINAIEKIIGKLNHYLFCILPQAGIIPPTPINFGRKHIEGIGVPPLSEAITRRDHISTIERFFDFLTEIAPFEEQLKGFNNPILYIDKPVEKALRQTRKAAFRVDDFRLLYELCHAIADFSWHVAKTIGEGNSPNNWTNILNDKNANRILSTEDFGYIPFIRFRQLNGEWVYIKLYWLPINVVPTTPVDLKTAREKWTLIPNLHAIHVLTTALETGLRHIHIRWLDKNRFIFNLPTEGSSTFDLLVNTDKVRGEWVRPTSISILKLLSRQVESQTWINSEHFKNLLYYDGHEYSTFDKICPIFIKYSANDVYSAPSSSHYFKNFIYFFNLIKIGLGQTPKDSIPHQICNLKFEIKSDFIVAADYCNAFKTKYSPHGLRATVVSINAPLLPASIIGEQITGQVSCETVRYYTVVNSDYINDIKQLNKNIQLANQNKCVMPITISPERNNSNLRRALSASPIIDVLSEFGAFSLSSESAKGEYQSGLSHILETHPDQIKLNPTHICPFNNNCPDDIIKSLGTKKCGQCHYSIKTVDHIPRILAHCCVLNRQLEYAKDQLLLAEKNSATDESLEIIEDELLHISGELSAWVLTAKVLSNNFDGLKNRVLINKPEMLLQQLQAIAKPNTALENLLIQCDEAAAYPDLADSSLYADVNMYRARLLTLSGSIESLFEPIEHNEILDNFRGLIRGVCIATGKSITEIAKLMEDNSSNRISQLKKLEEFYDQ